MSELTRDGAATAGAPFDVTYLRQHLRYMVWAIRRGLEASRPLNEEELHRQLGTPLENIRGLLSHIFGASWWFYSLLTEEQPPYPDWLESAATPVPVFMIEDDLRDLLGRYEVLAGRLGEPDQAAAWAAGTVTAHGAAIPRWQATLNVVSHSTYHLGQLACDLRLVGRKGLDTDIIRYFFEAEGRKWPSPAP